MKLLFMCVVSLILTHTVYAADTPASSHVTIKDGVIQVFPENPKSGNIAREQIEGKQLWVSAVRSSGKTRQIRLTSYVGRPGSRTPVKFLYPFSDASATWNMEVKREGDIVSLQLPWNGTLIGDILDVNEGASSTAGVRKKLGLTAPDSKLPVALGRSVRYSDRQRMDHLHEQAIANGYKLQDMVLDLIASDVFVHR